MALSWGCLEEGNLLNIFTLQNKRAEQINIRLISKNYNHSFQQTSLNIHTYTYFDSIQKGTESLIKTYMIWKEPDFLSIDGES